MCGLGLVGGAPGEEAGLSGLLLLHSGDDGGRSVGDGVAARRGEVGVGCAGPAAGGSGAGLEGEEEEEVGGALRLGDKHGLEATSEPAGERGWGDTEKVVGVRRPNLASSSLHTARLLLAPSPPPPPPPEMHAAASEPLASSWQRSTKLPRRTAPPHSRSCPACLTGRGLWEGWWAGLWAGLWAGMARRAGPGSREGLA